MAKYISFIFTCGGDAGARFSNRLEWNSAEGQLLFDSSIWTMESIQKAIIDLYKDVSRREPWCHTMSDIMDNLFEYLNPFVDDTNGVFINVGYHQSNGLPGWTAGKDKSKRISPAPEEIERWNINGDYFCKYY